MEPRAGLILIAVLSGGLPGAALAERASGPTVMQVHAACEAWLLGSQDRIVGDCLDAVSQLYRITFGMRDRRGICIPPSATPAAFAFAYTRYVSSLGPEARQWDEEPWQALADELDAGGMALPRPLGTKEIAALPGPELSPRQVVAADFECSP